MDCMIDMETIGQRADTGMCTFAAIRFDRHADYRELGCETIQDIIDKTDCFYRRVELGSLHRDQFSWDESTMDWWEKQTKEARHEAFAAKPRVDVEDLLKDFAAWNDDEDYMWSHGSDFDLVILQTAYRRLGTFRDGDIPWKFWQGRCTRTLFDVCNLDRNDQKAMRSGMHHHALADTFDQILMVQECYRRMK